jgi:hypothetical protein
MSQTQSKVSQSSGIIGTRKFAAEMLGVTARQLSNWTKEPWFPEDGRTTSGWDVPLIRVARDAMGRVGSNGSDQAKKIKLASDGEKLKQAIIKTQIEDLKLKEQERELLPRRSIELFVSSFLTSYGDWAEQLPDLVVGDLPKRHRAAFKARLKDELDRKRDEMRVDLESKMREIDGGDADS